ncbi:MAG TPA: autotransporter-associated beta strand repeat-containing protein, partial [Lacipirellulaceae bacterium]|nr:autotransporter-associated beta strand repeat-containing protein [Lacipirellulaceae bacterium]
PIKFLDAASATALGLTAPTNTTYVLANPTTTSALTIPNPLNWRSDANTTLIYTGATAVTFSNVTLGTGVNNTLTIANNQFQSAKMIINNLGGAANNFIVQSQNTANGTLVLTGNTTYTGTVQIGGNTAIASGQPTLQADDGTTLSSSSFLNLNGGVLQTSGTFGRDISTAGAGLMDWNTNGGGFSAIGSQLTVNIGLNDGFGGFELPWGTAAGSGIVGTLRFGSVSTNAKTLFVNPIDMAAASGTTRTISVTAGTGTDYTEINQVIRNGQNSDAPLQKTGTGTLLLSAANTFTGPVQITGGALQAVQGTGLPTTSLVSLDGGVYEGVGATSFSRSFGTTGTAVQWTANGGGFSANGGQMTVNIGGSGAQVVWGTTVGSQIVGPLVFGSHTSNAKTVFTNPIDLDNVATAATRTVTVNSGAGGDSAEISGALSNSSGAAILTKAGAGTLLLSAANSYTGGTTLSAGTLALGNAGALPSTGPLALGGGTLSNVSGSAIVAPNVTTLTANTTLAGTSALTLNGGLTNSGGNRTLTLSNTAGTTLGAINLSEAAATGRTLTLTGNNNVTITGPIQNASTAGAGNGALTFNSAFHGTATLSGASTYTGATTISGGTVLATNTSGSATGTGAVTTAAGTTLGGTGTIGGAVTNKGILAPGVGGVGTLSIGGNLTDSAASSWSIDLSGATADKVAVTGNIDLTAADTLNVTGAGTGSSWLIGTYAGTLTGMFDTVTSGYTVSYAGGNITLNTVGGGGLPGDYNQNGVVDEADYVLWRNNVGQPAGTLPNDTTGVAIGDSQYNLWRGNFGNHSGAGSSLGSGSAVPEPTTIAMLLFGLVALVPRRSR